MPSMQRSTRDLDEVVREARYEGAPAVALIAVAEVGLALLSERDGWSLWRFPWWIWLLLGVPAMILATSLGVMSTDESPRHRRAALSLVTLLVAANALVLASVVASLLTETPTGTELLVKALTVWASNVVTFALWLWELDGGGPIARAMRRAHVELQFPQDENPQLASAGWHPRLVDYLYVSLTNSIAFSPTDAMPLTPRVKGVMALESIVSIGTIVLVAARAVNVLR